MRRLWLALVLVAAPAFAEPAVPQLQVTQRYAVIVGSNAGVQERPGLRFSHRDAKSFAQVLLDVGRFTKKDVALLLDPAPEQVLGALDGVIAQAKAAGGKTMLVFYYSGHADGQSLFPNGQPLGLAELKSRLGDEAVELRVGIIDGCSGGGWTQAKGLRPAEPFALGPPQLESEGTVLLSSSSGLEDAHEAEVLQGSFFTHHLVAGLRGAADSSRDGQVTLNEAFGYANQMTIRDTAQVAKVPQHPSFDMRLRGRQDVVLSALASAASSLTLIQEQGPLQVVQLATGQLIAESPAGEGTFTLAVPAGDYVVRRVEERGVMSKKVTVEPMSSESLDESSLMPTDGLLLASKGVSLTAYSELPPQYELAAAVGARTNDGENPSALVEGSFTWRLSRKLSWRVARAAYNFTDGRTYNSRPSTYFRGGTDLMFTFYRSEQLPKGFRFESMLSVGPSVAVLRWSAGVLSPASTAIGLGPSLEIAADFRLPYMGDVHVRPAFGTDFIFPMATGTGVPSLAVGLRGTLSLAWRFGALQ